MNLGQWLGFSSLILSLYILWQIRQLLLLVFTAIILATALNRLVKYVQKFNFKRNLAITIVLVSFLLLIALFNILIIPPFVEQFQKLIELVPSVWNQIYQSIQNLEQIEWIPDLPNLEEIIRQLQPLSANFVGKFFTIFSNSLGTVLQTLFILVLAVMMLAEPQAYRSVLIQLFPSFYRRRADEILTLTESALANWLAGVTLNCIFIGTLSGVGLSILGIKLVLVHALLAGLLNVIPNIGPTASVIFPIMIALLEDPWKIIAILIWYFIIQNIESYWLTPMVMAKQVSLLPAITLIAQIFFTTAFGLLGLLLALPLTVVAKTWLEEVLFKDVLDRWQLATPESNYQELSSEDYLVLTPEVDDTNHSNQESGVRESESQEEKFH